MPEASTLADLLRIRRANQALLRKQGAGYRGSAVGFKFSEKNRDWVKRKGQCVPAIVFFVEEKWKSGQRPKGSSPPLPTKLSAGALSCETDVVEGQFADDIPWLPSLPATGESLVQGLFESKAVVGGIPIRSPLATGAAACVVQQGNRRSLLTNAHVAGQAGNPIERPEPQVVELGETEAACLVGSEIPPKSRARWATPWDAFLESVPWIDSALVRLRPSVVAIARAGVSGLPPLQSPSALDLESLADIGRLLTSVGPSGGRSHGRLMGIAYEWKEGDQYYHADLLILGCREKTPHAFTGLPFAAEGDSGKLVVTADTFQPIGVLWGGHRLQFDSLHNQHAWCLATDINRILSGFDVRIVPAGNQPTAPASTPP